MDISRIRGVTAFASVATSDSTSRRRTTLAGAWLLGVACVLLASAGQAALDLKIAQPETMLDSGLASFDGGTQLLSIDAVPMITEMRAGKAVTHDPGGALTLNAQFDNHGMLLVSPGNSDLILVGTAGDNGTPLLQGDIIGFTHIPAKSKSRGAIVTELEFRILITGGSLAGNFPTGEAGLSARIPWEDSGLFKGSWSLPAAVRLGAVELSALVPEIDLVKATNGIDGSSFLSGNVAIIPIGDPVDWTYTVTNVGSEPLINLMVTDDQGVVVTCPVNTLDPGETTVCTGSGIAEDTTDTTFSTERAACGVQGRLNTLVYRNRGLASAVTADGSFFVKDTNTSRYCNPADPQIDIEKATNGIDADDPNAGDAPQIAPGDVVTWTYVVTNTGNRTIDDIVVTDDQGVALTCPSDRLDPGASMICTGAGLAEDLENTGFATVPGTCGSIPNTPLYENFGTASGTTFGGEFVQDTDPSHYCNPPGPAIDIEKATNGVDADDPNAGDAPQIMPGQLVSWTYLVTNTGSTVLNNIVVTDDQGVPVSCPQTTLAPGDTMLCTASGIAENLNSTGFATVPGLCGITPNTPLYENFGQVIGESPTGEFVQDLDPSHYCNPQEPDIDIEKATNGVDADNPNAGDAPQIMPGDPVSWTYVVTNTGNTTLTDVTVTDDQGVTVTCPQTTLAPGDSMLCTANGIAENLDNTTFTTVPGLCGGFPNTPLYENFGQATGTGPSGDFVQDLDPSHYCNPQEPDIDIEKATNGVDADDPNAGDAPQIMPGDTVSWLYVVTNTGNVTLTDVTVTDDQGVPVACPQTTLDPGASMNCTAMGVAEDLSTTGFTTVPGLCGGLPNTPMYENFGLATGISLTGDFVQDTDPSHYCNPQEPDIDIEKSTNGVDADNPNGPDVPQILPGDPVSWTYLVTNTGSVPLINVTVTDDQAVAVTCPMNTLNPGQSMLCTANGVAADLINTGFTTVPGLCGGFPNTPLYENRGIANGNAMTGAFVQDVDPSHYCNPPIPDIDIEKSTNGVDADNANAGDAPTVSPGGAVTWTYLVTNTGNVTLVNVTVDDDQGVAVTCPLGTLLPGQSMLCSATGVAEDLDNTGFTTVPGLCLGIPDRPLYENMGTATGESVTGDPVQDTDPSHYCNPPAPDIDVEKATNGVDADDPNAGDAPQIMPGGVVSWTYVVTNTGDVLLTDVSVSDDQGVAVTCPMNTLNPGQSMTCTASGVADDLDTTTFTTVPGLCGGFPATPLYENRGIATGITQLGDFVQDVDPSHYCNPQQPDIDIEKATNGVDADNPNAGDAPQIMTGNVVTWTYVVTNTGSVTLFNVTVIDDQGVPVSCPQNTLEPGEVMNCSASGLAEDLLDTTFTTVPGQCAQFPNIPMYENFGSVTGESITGEIVQDIDPSHYCNPQEPDIDIEKATNGIDADDPNAGDAPQIMPGDVVTWTYLVTNTGNVTLTNVGVLDDQGVPVSCPQVTLAPGASMTCSASGLADDLGSTPFTTVPGLCGAFPNTPLYENMGTATGETATGEFVEDVDASHYCNPQEPDIDIEKATNGVDADNPNAGDAPQIGVGNIVTWTYLVTNTGNVPLVNVMVTDDQGVPVSCPQDTLAPSATMLCTASGIAEELLATTFTTVPGLCGSFPMTPLYENFGTVTGESVAGDFVDDTDPSHYCNPQSPDIDIEKATNGVDADDPNAGDAPQIMTGNTVNWSYLVTNTGNVPLVNVVVTDDQGATVTCPQTTLAVGANMLCTATGTADNLLSTGFTTVPGLCGSFPMTPLYENVGAVVGETLAGSFVEDDDPSHYCNPQSPDIDIEKNTNGVDADDPNAGDAPQLAPGDPVFWTYLVTNTGNVPLTDVGVLDDQGVTVTCPQNTLAPGASMTCTASGLADDLATTGSTTVPGLCGEFPNTPLYENMGIATGQTTAGDFVEDVDASHYCNPPSCSLDVGKTCLIPMPPAGEFTCDKPIDSLTMIWDGTGNVRIKAWKGNVGSTLLADIDGIVPGQEVTVIGYAGSPNDVFWEVFNAGTSTKIGESKYHLSCSDDAMNGPEDCGLNQGNGKGNDSGLINDWLLEGMVDASGTLDCTAAPPDPGNNNCSFQAFPASCETGDADFLTFAYTGGGCAASDNDQEDHDCFGSVNGSLPATFTDDDGNSVLLNPGETVTIERNLAKDMTLSNSGGTETNELHTSCSQPLQAGDVYGSLTLAQIDGQGIGTDVIYSYTITNTSNIDITSLSAVDIPLGPVPGTPSSLAAGQSVTLLTSAFLTETTTNTVIVDGAVADGQMCNATAQATVTILAPPPCDVDGEGVLELKDKKAKWILTNSGAFTATIDSIDISWPSANGGIKKIKLDGDVFSGLKPAPSALFGPADFHADLDRRQLSPGETRTLEFEFEHDVVQVQDAYSITINFDEGCSITYVNTGLPFVCTKPIDSLSMLWDGGADPIRIKAWKGNVGSTLLADQSGIGNGDEVTVTGFAGSPNDVFWEVFSGGTKIGESKFHLSCSDNDMNGAEDCGKRQGNGKDNNGGLVNDWLLEGMVDADGAFDCSGVP